jgi:amino acid adenylation domain-containing protein
MSLEALDTATTTVVALIDDSVAVRADEVAVRAADATLTYRELSERADRLAHELRHAGVETGDLVGLCVNRSSALVVGALGIVRAGAAFVAIDPEYPEERRRWMLEDSGATASVIDLATDKRFAVTAPVPQVVLEAGGELADPRATDLGRELPGPPSPSDIAYVVYTSGSTGQPKGVLVDHAGLANLVAWHLAAFEVTAESRCTQIASPGFDASVWEIWPTLAAGAALHVVPDELKRDPVGLRDWLVSEGINVTFLPTAVADVVIGLSWPDQGELRYLLTGGDALSARPSADLGFAVINNYGLSETAVVATSGPVSSDGDGPPTIGRAISGVEIEIVDDELRPVAQGEAGELIVGGVAVSPGYLNRPELTAERFLISENGRRYRTGDRVRMRDDGDIEFAGRLDDQLSIRGFRVEPGEIASALNGHPSVETSVVIGVGSSNADRQLVAYAVAANGKQPSGEELGEFLGGVLPEYMVPARFVWLDELPQTAHGKIDRSALVALDEAPAPATSDAQGRGPETEIERSIVAVMAELLEISEDELGMEQNFFLLGGHSMLGAQLIARLDRLYGAEVSLRYLFDHPTPAAIAAEVERQAAETAETR